MGRIDVASSTFESVEHTVVLVPLHAVRLIRAHIVDAGPEGNVVSGLPRTQALEAVRANSFVVRGSANSCRVHEGGGDIRVIYIYVYIYAWKREIHKQEYAALS